MKPSKYQEAIYTWVKEGTGNAIIQAVAGSGKTTTIVECAKIIPKSDKSIFVAFNKAIATELQARLPDNVSAKTLHALGLSMFYGNTNVRPTVKGDKLNTIIAKILFNNDVVEDTPEWRTNYFQLKKIIPLLKAFNVDYTNYGKINDVVISKGLEDEINLSERFLSFIRQVMDKCKRTVDVIDFDDMIWIPVQNDFKCSTFNWVFVDETQDMNKVQNELVKKICNEQTRVIMVGDRRQSIYAFRGADTQSMDNCKEYFNAVEMPLSICYRCPKEHIKLAQEIVPELEAFDGAKEGVVGDLSLDKTIEKAEDGDLILCRTNAPLVRMAFALIRADKKAVIKGRDIGKNLLKMIRKYKCFNLEDLQNKVGEFLNLQEEKLTLIEQGELDRRLKNSLLVNIDCCETILVITENVENIEQLKSKIEEIFTDDRVGIVCSSVHKAKGLEADRIFILEYDNMPHPMAKNEEEIEQEYNIKYVALTRSRNELYFIGE